MRRWTLQTRFSQLLSPRETRRIVQKNTKFRNGYPRHPSNGIEVRWTSNFILNRDVFHDDGKPRKCRGIALNPTGSRARKNISGAYVTIEEPIPLKPAPLAGDPNPQSEVDLKLSAGTLRQAGTKLVDSHTDRMSAARLTKLMINQLPPSQRPIFLSGTAIGLGVKYRPKRSTNAKS